MKDAVPRSSAIAHGTDPNRLHSGNAYLLFDGDCGVCTSLAEIARSMDSKCRFTIRPYQSFDEAGLREFKITYAKCRKRIYVMSRAGHVYPGAFGVNYFLLDKFPWNLVVLLMYLVPVLLVFEVIGYRIFALNRARISGWLGLTACGLSPHQDVARSSETR